MILVCFLSSSSSFSSELQQSELASLPFIRRRHFRETDVSLPACFLTWFVMKPDSGKVDSMCQPSLIRADASGLIKTVRIRLILLSALMTHSRQ